VDLVGSVERRQDIGDVVAVDFLDMPAKGPPLLCQGFKRHHIGRRASLLDPVAVDDRHKIAESVLRRRHHALPHDPGVELAVAKQDVYSPP
jgi:hypothetical protein